MGIAFNLISILLIGFLCYLFYFKNLGLWTSRMWDEARNGVNALEMLKNGNLLVTYFRGAPDLWNVKPPFYIWTVTVLFKIFGPSDYLLRLPSALAASFVTFAIYFFAKTKLKRPGIGLLASLILLSSMGFPDAHIARTGDYDAMLTLWVFLTTTSFYTYTQEWNKRDLILSFIFLTLAVFTKGVAGLFMVPGVLLYLLLTRRLMNVIKTPTFWKALFISVLFIAAYYLGREAVNPLYLHTVMKEELGRYGNITGSKISDFGYYWRFFTDFRFQKWIYLIPLSIVSIFVTKEKKLKDWIILSYIISVWYFLLISLSSTKNLWYDAQLYPFMSLLAAIFIAQLIKQLPILLRIIPIAILAYYLQLYLRTNLAFINRPDLEKSNSCIAYGYLFRDKAIDKSGFYGTHETENTCFPFTYYLEKDGLSSKKISEIEAQDKILTCDMPTLELITNRFTTSQIFDTVYGCRGIKINSLKR